MIEEMENDVTLEENVALEKVEGNTTTVSFGATAKESKSEIINETTITDPKQLFNLSNKSCDKVLNDCVGQKIRIVDILIRTIITPLEEPILNEVTGEMKDIEIKRITILIDDMGLSYVTKSNLFAFDIQKLQKFYSVEQIKEGIDIEIIKTKVQNSNNLRLGFKLL